MLSYRKRFLSLSLCVAVSLTGCQRNKHAANEIIVGTISGPETVLMETAKTVAKMKYDINITIVPFNDYVLPNQALADGSLDANMYQHQPYLDAAVKAKGFKLVAIGKTFVYPMGIYSKKLSNLTHLQPKSVVAIPNDPSNEARALLLLAKAKLITLQDQASSGMNATLQSITHNPLNLQFKEMDAAQLPRVLDDVDIAAINTNYAMVAGLLPSKDALFSESAESPYANIVVVREADKDDAKMAKLMLALHSNAVEAKAKSLFKGQAIAAWK